MEETNVYETDFFKDCRVFYFDVETSGCEGMPLLHDNNRILQLCAVDAETGDKFNCLGNPMFDSVERIPEESVKTHRITEEVLQMRNAKPTITMVNDFVKWVNGKVEVKQKKLTEEEMKMPPEKRAVRKKTPLFFAHNASFDQNAVYKALSVESFGENCEALGWVFFDTLEAIKKYFSFINRNYLAKQRPHRLENLFKYFYPNESQFLGHNADADVGALKRLCEEYLFPEMQKHGVTHISEGVGYFIHPFPKAPLATRLIDISGFGEVTVKHITKEVNNEFIFSDTYKGLVTTPDLISAFHLLIYGRKKQLECKTHPDGDDEWFQILQQIEIMLRTKLKKPICSDNYIVNVLSLIAGKPALELYYHTCKNNGDTTYFPTCSGMPCAYLPWKINKKEAAELKRLGINSFNELYSYFLVSRNKQVFVSTIAEHLGKHIDYENLYNLFGKLVYRKKDKRQNESYSQRGNKNKIQRC